MRATSDPGRGVGAVPVSGGHPTGGHRRSGSRRRHTAYPWWYGSGPLASGLQALPVLVPASPLVVEVNAAVIFVMSPVGEYVYVSFCAFAVAPVEGVAAA